MFYDLMLTIFHIRWHHISFKGLTNNDLRTYWSVVKFKCMKENKTIIIIIIIIRKS